LLGGTSRVFLSNFCHCFQAANSGVLPAAGKIGLDMLWPINSFLVVFILYLLLVKDLSYSSEPTMQFRFLKLYEIFGILKHDKFNFLISEPLWKTWSIKDEDLLGGYVCEKAVVVLSASLVQSVNCCLQWCSATICSLFPQAHYNGLKMVYFFSMNICHIYLYFLQVIVVCTSELSPILHCFRIFT
jgi:hypothetical protein